MPSLPRVLLQWIALFALAAGAAYVLAGPLSLEPVPLKAELDEAAGRLRDDEFREALRITSRLVAAHPGSADALALHGLALLRAGELAPARRRLAQAEAADPNLHEVALGLGRMAFGGNRIQESLGHLRRAVEGGRLQREAADDLRRALAYAGKIDEALRVAERTLKMDEGLGGVTGAEIRTGMDYLETLAPGETMRIAAGFTGTVIEMLPRQEESGRRIREIPVELNDGGAFPFDIDSAYGGNLTLSPQLADRLGLERTGSFAAAGVGKSQRTTQGARLDRIRMGDLVVENVPVLVLDSPTFRGEAKGLLGTGLLRRFDCTLDVEAGTLEIRPHGRPLLRGGPVDPSRIALKAPLFVQGGPVLPVAMGRGRPKPFLLDTGASVTLVDDDYFAANVEPGMEPGGASKIQIRGMGGAEEALLLPSARIRIGEREFAELRVVVVDLERINRIARRYADGILGINLLWRYRVHLNFSVPELVLEERPGEGKDRAATPAP